METQALDHHHDSSLSQWPRTLSASNSRRVRATLRYPKDSQVIVLDSVGCSADLQPSRGRRVHSPSKIVEVKNRG